MTAYWGVEKHLHSFLTLSIDASGWSPSCPGCFTPRNAQPLQLDTKLSRTPQSFRTPWWKRKSLAPSEYQTPVYSFVQPESLSLYQLSYCVVKSVVLPDVQGRETWPLTVKVIAQIELFERDMQCNGVEQRAKWFERYRP